MNQCSGVTVAELSGNDELFHKRKRSSAVYGKWKSLTHGAIVGGYNNLAQLSVFILEKDKNSAVIIFLSQSIQLSAYYSKNKENKQNLWESVVFAAFLQAPAGFEIKWLLSLHVNRCTTCLNVHCYKHGWNGMGGAWQPRTWCYFPVWIVNRLFNCE